MNRIRKELISKSAALNLISILLYSSLVLLANGKDNSQSFPPQKIFEFYAVFKVINLSTLYGQNY